LASCNLARVPRGTLRPLAFREPVCVVHSATLRLICDDSSTDMPRRFALASLALLVLFGCASRSPSASREEINQAVQAYSDCLHRAAAGLDNGTSDVASLAPTVRDYCTPEYQRLVELYSRGMNPQAKSRLLQKAQATHLNDATEVVLQHRAQRKAPAQ